jgi:hypothetical protein
MIVLVGHVVDRNGVVKMSSIPHESARRAEAGGANPAPTPRGNVESCHGVSEIEFVSTRRRHEETPGVS